MASKTFYCPSCKKAMVTYATGTTPWDGQYEYDRIVYRCKKEDIYITQETPIIVEEAA